MEIKIITCTSYEELNNLVWIDYKRGGKDLTEELAKTKEGDLIKNICIFKGTRPKYRIYIYYEDEEDRRHLTKIINKIITREKNNPKKKGAK